MTQLEEDGRGKGTGTICPQLQGELLADFEDNCPHLPGDLLKNLLDNLSTASVTTFRKL